MKRSLLYVGDKDPYALREHIIQEAFYGMTESFRKKNINVILTTNEHTECFALNLGKIITRTTPTEIVALFTFTQKFLSAYWLISKSNSKSANTETNARSTSPRRHLCTTKVPGHLSHSFCHTLAAATASPPAYNHWKLFPSPHYKHFSPSWQQQPCRELPLPAPPPVPPHDRCQHWWHLRRHG